MAVCNELLSYSTGWVMPTNCLSLSALRDYIDEFTISPYHR